MSESVIAQLAVLVFLLLSSFLGRWLSRLDHSSRRGAEPENGVVAGKSVQGLPYVDRDAGTLDTSSMENDGSHLPDARERWARGSSYEPSEREEMVEPVLVRSEETVASPQNSLQAEETNRAMALPARELFRLSSTASSRGETRRSQQYQRFETLVRQPLDLRDAFRLALLLAPPRTLALDTQPDPDRIQP